MEPKTTITDGYGCHNRQRKAGYYAPDRKYREDGTWEVVQTWIENTMTLDCGFKRSYTHERCERCDK